MHENLIQTLSENLQPVRPLPSARWREFILWCWAALAVGLGLGYWQWRTDELHLPLGRSLVEIFILFVSVKITGAFAVRSVSPHTAQAKTHWRSWGAVITWALLLLAAFWRIYAVNPQEATIAAHAATWGCPTVIVSISLPLTLILFLYLRRGAALFPKTTGLYLAQTAFVFGALGLAFICPWDDPLHELLWHVLPVTILSLAAAAVAMFFFRRQHKYPLS